MCHEPTARPPLPPVAGGAGVAGTEELVLQAADGNRFNAFSATAVAPDAPGIMILPDVRGLHPFYKDLAVRFAEAGVHAAAGGGARQVYSVGFCMGGRISFNQAWRDHGLAGVIGFYGGPQGGAPTT